MGPENLCFMSNSQVMLTLLAQTLGPRGLNSTGVSRDQWPGGMGARVGRKCPDVWTCILHVQQRLSAVSGGEGSWLAALQFTLEFVQLQLWAFLVCASGCLSTPPGSVPVGHPWSSGWS